MQQDAKQRNWQALRSSEVVMRLSNGGDLPLQIKQKGLGMEARQIVMFIDLQVLVRGIFSITLLD